MTPSAVSTSAEPDFDDSARLPCLATGTPQPATTSALAVEMLKLPEPSPPVPQVSIVPGGASIATALARMIRAAPVISSTVSPRTRSAISSAPICDGVALPLMMMSNAASASLSDSACPAATLASSGLQIAGVAGGVHRNRLGDMRNPVLRRPLYQPDISGRGTVSNGAVKKRSAGANKRGPSNRGAGAAWREAAEAVPAVGLRCGGAACGGAAARCLYAGSGVCRFAAAASIARSERVSPSSSMSISRRSWSRPRDRRERTVPTGTSRITATSS